MSENDLSAISDNAHAYNDDIAARGSYIHEMSAQELDEYNSLLNVGGSGMMGHIEIEKLGVDLPLYHTVDEAVLQVGVGHIPGSSLPVGGPSTHTVLSGHRGLPTSKLFTELDRMEEGDIFSLYVLDQQLVYEVDQILTVLPDEVSGLKIEEGRDLCTLVTCTPYAINTHRLLVRGHRIDYEVSIYVMADAVRMDSVLVSSVIAIPILTALLIALLVRIHRRRQRQKLGQITPEVVSEALRASNAPPGKGKASKKDKKPKKGKASKKGAAPAEGDVSDVDSGSAESETPETDTAPAEDSESEAGATPAKSEKLNADEAEQFDDSMEAPEKGEG